MPKSVTQERAQNFARNVQRWLKIDGLSLKQAAEKSGVDYRLLQRWASKGLSRRGANTEEPLMKLVRAMRWPEKHIERLFDHRGYWGNSDPSSSKHVLERANNVLIHGSEEVRREMIEAINKAYRSRNIPWWEPIL